MNKEKSFTLLELLVVIAVIAILAAVVLISLSDARQRANEARGLQFSQNIKSTLATDLVGEWTFDDENNPGRDDSGNNNNGIIYNGTNVCNYSSGQPSGCPVWSDTYPQAKVRGALSFDGNDYVDCGSNSSLNIVNNITIESWVRFSGLSTSERIVYKRSGNYGVGLQNPANTGYLQFFFYNSGGTTYAATSISSYNNEKWHHVVGSYDATTIKLYIDGAEVRSVSSTASIYYQNQTASIGRNANETNRYWNGAIDEVRIYKRALTAYEIKALYAEGKMRYLAEK